MKKILISVLAFDVGKSGIADYIISVCRELSKRHKLELLIHPSDAEIFPVKNPNIAFTFVAEYLKKPLFSMFWHLYILPFLIKNDEYDLILLPAGNRRLFARFPAQTVVTFHDLAQYYVPDKYDRFRMFYVKTIIPHYLRKAPIVMAISENTKNDLIKYYNLPLELIEVNYNGYNAEELKTDLSEADIRQVYNLQRPYFLYNSRIEHPVKNHLHLIRAFELLPDDVKENYDIVFTGIESRGSKEVFDYVKGSLVKNNIKFLGYVDSNYMGALYKYADLYLFPSLYEGFGIPLLEAMACGIPVLCSNRSSLPEIGGDAVVTFDPEMHADIAAKILKVLNNPDLRHRMIERGLERVKHFSWQNHVEKMMSLVETKPKNRKRTNSEN
ncbi:MAG: glycosyltransferase family 1 protein [Candidatus Cloacimonadaceae bacterium]